jgi:hypothetical protein
MSALLQHKYNTLVGDGWVIGLKILENYLGKLTCLQQGVSIVLKLDIANENKFDQKTTDKLKRKRSVGHFGPRPWN